MTNTLQNHRTDSIEQVCTHWKERERERDRMRSDHETAWRIYGSSTKKKKHRSQQLQAILDPSPNLHLDHAHMLQNDDDDDEIDFGWILLRFMQQLGHETSCTQNQLNRNKSQPGCCIWDRHRHTENIDLLLHLLGLKHSTYQWGSSQLRSVALPLRSDNSGSREMNERLNWWQTVGGCRVRERYSSSRSAGRGRSFEGVGIYQD